MSLKINGTFLTGAMLAAVMAGGLGGCGKKGVLETPAPLFGERAKSDYDAQRRAASAQPANGPTKSVPAADQPDPNADNAPPSTRDVKAPEQMDQPITQAPIPGAPDLMGPTPSMKPPGQ